MRVSPLAFLRCARPWRLPLILLLSLCAALAQAQPQEAPRPRPLPQDQPGSTSVFPAHTGRVVDGAGVIDAATAARLDRLLAAHEAASGDQVVVVTVPALRGMAIEEFGYQLGRMWGIGQQGKDNGVLLIVSRDDRKLRIEVGYGLEGKLTDGQSSEIINQVIVPAFRRGDQAGGIARGVDAILQVLQAPADTLDLPDRPRLHLPIQAPVIFAVEPVEPSPQDGGRLFGITALVFAGFILLMVRLVRGRPFGPAPEQPPALMLAAAPKGKRSKDARRSSSSSSSRASSSSSSSRSSSRSSSSRGGGGSFGGGGASGSW